MCVCGFMERNAHQRLNYLFFFFFSFHLTSGLLVWSQRVFYTANNGNSSVLIFTSHSKRTEDEHNGDMGVLFSFFVSCFQVEIRYVESKPPENFDKSGVQH